MGDTLVRIKHELDFFFDSFEKKYEHKDFNKWASTTRDELEKFMTPYLRICAMRVSDKLFDAIYKKHLAISRMILSGNYEHAKYCWFAFCVGLHPASDIIPEEWIIERLPESDRAGFFIYTKEDLFHDAFPSDVRAAIIIRKMKQQ